MARRGQHLEIVIVRDTLAEMEEEVHRARGWAPAPWSWTEFMAMPWPWGCT